MDVNGCAHNNFLLQLKTAVLEFSLTLKSVQIYFGKHNCCNSN